MYAYKSRQLPQSGKRLVADIHQVVLRTKVSKMENYRRLQKLGSGNFAKVHLAVHIPSKTQVALKMIRKRDISSARMYKRLHREVHNMKKLDHINVIKIFETFETRDHHVIAMEYLSGGELYDYVLDREGLPETEGKDMFCQIVNAVQHCHLNGVTHRDLKLENILLDGNHHPKIADFGLSKDTHAEPTIATYCGSPLYTSPEIILKKPYLGPECDVWSLGVILYTMLTATMPFDDSNFAKFMHQVGIGEYPEPLGVSDSVKHLISRMLDPCATSRITVQDILSHPWMMNLSSNTSVRRRRNGVCHCSPDNVRQSLLELNDCNCTCHKADSSPRRSRDSVISKHCEDCDDFVANDPAVMHRRQVRLSRDSSICSSGYGSEFGSQYLSPMTPRASQNAVKAFFDNHLTVHRSSIPRKSNVCTHHRGSVPTNTNILQQCINEPILGSANEDDDIVFV